MKKTLFSLFMLALLPVLTFAQADQKLMNKAQQGDTKAMVLLGECYENGAGVDVDSTLALKWFQRAADQGDGEGWLRISRYYMHSTLLPKDTARYFAIRKEWADKGLPNGLAALATCYEYGFGVAVDSAKALELNQQAVKAGASWGYENMALNLDYGYGDLAKDEKKAVSYWEKAYKLGDISSCGDLAGYYYNKGDYKKAKKWAQEGAKWNDATSQTLIALMYLNGVGEEEDEAKAQQILSALITKRHNLGFTQAVAGEAYMYPDDVALRDTAKAIRIWEEGSHFSPSIASLCQMDLGRYYNSIGQYEKAFRYFKTVAEKEPNHGGKGEACYYLSMMYYGGEGCEADPDQTISWLRRGAEVMHNAQCAAVLASFYEEEPYKDLPQAVKYYRMADQLGESSAMEYLGHLYARSGNADAAIECYDKMIEKGLANGYYHKAMVYEGSGDHKTCNSLLATGYKKGSSLCAYSLGAIYENGLDGYKVDYKKAAQYYTKANTPAARYRLSSLYLNQHIGKGKEKDIATGLDLLKSAAADGFTPALNDLGHCYAYGWYTDTVDQEKAVQCFQTLADNGEAEGYFMMGLYNEAAELSAPSIPADSVEALRLIQKAADLGHPDAKCYLGDYYRGGHFVPEDKAKAFSLYQEAHEAGFTKGTYYVGRSYLEGCGVEVDTLRAMAYLKDAAANGVGNAAYRVAEIYNHGLGGVTADGDSAIAYYLSAYQNGNGAACSVIGQALANEEAYDKAAEFFATGTQRGDLNSALSFATYLQNGIGVDPDPKTAYSLFERVARQTGDPRAYGAMGLACLQGNGCPEDESLGKAYLDTAVSRGHEPSNFYLGLCYLNGYGCRTDTTMAISYLEKAADNEHIRAINVLGDIYREQGELKNAVLYYEKAVTLGSLEGYCNLGYCYQEGLGVVLNSQKAYEMYKFAADHEYNRGYRMVASCYMNGIYVEQSMAEALNWLTKAAENGDVMAMYYCGAILEEGEEGVTPNPKKAREWYKKAATAGYEPAQVALSRMK